MLDLETLGRVQATIFNVLQLLIQYLRLIKLIQNVGSRDTGQGTGNHF